MTKRSLSILLATLLISLVGCELNKSSSNKNSSFLSSSSNNVSSNSTTSSSFDVSSSSADVISSSSVMSSSSSIVSSSSSVMSSSSSIVSSSSSSSSSEEYYDLSSKVFNSSNYTSIGGYDTGNYDTTSVSGVSFTHYRAVEPSGSDMMTLLPYVSNENDNSLAGMIYNTTAIKGIKKFIIKYRTQNGSGSKPILRYGNDISVENSVELDLSTSNNTMTINVKNANYFKVETNGYKLYLVSIEVQYTGEGTPETYTYLKSGEGDYRINPVTFSGSKVSGQSSVNVPISVTKNGDSYIVDEYKTYTYYTYSAVSSSTSLASKAAYTTPEDVAAYFVAFGEAPANFVAKKQYSNAKSIFGSNARCVSNYKRTDGYARFIPWAKAPGQTYPIYYECDIDLDGTYSNNNRGVGRVVVWLHGFDYEGYSNAPVAVFTDDHYATFQEYLNTGRYGTRFNAELSPTNYVWGTPAILTV